MTGRHRRQVDGREHPAAGRAEGRRRSSSASLSDRSSSFETGPVRLEEVDGLGRPRPSPPAPRARHWPGRCPRPFRRRRRRGPSPPATPGRARAPRRCGGGPRRPSIPRRAPAAPTRCRCRTRANATASAFAAAKSSASAAARSLAMAHPRQLAELLDAPCSRGGPVGGGPDRQALQQCVHRRRHTVEAAEQHDLAVEELGLDRPGAAGEALPARPPLPLPRRRWATAAGSRLAARGPPRSSPRRCRRRPARPCPRAGPPAPAR